MPKPTKGPRLGGSPTHQRMILRNLAAQLFEHGRVVTTETKAKRLRPYAEKLISKAKRGDLHGRRMVLRDIPNKDAVHELYATVVPAVAERDGGYLRITKIGPRQGDNAPMAVIEVITESVDASRKRKAKPAAKPAPKVEEEKVEEKVESPESADSPDSPESPESAASPESADSAEEPEEEK